MTKIAALVPQLANNNSSVINVDHLDSDTLRALRANDIPLDVFDAAAGPDGRIRGKDEFKSLVSVLDQHDGTPNDGVITLADLEGVPTKAGVMHELIQHEITINQGKPWMIKPGTVPAETQPAPSIKDALIVPEADQVDRPPVQLNVQGKSQYEWARENGADGNKACYSAAVHQMTEHNKKARNGAPGTADGWRGIQAAYQEDSSGRTVVDNDQAHKAHEYIDRCLDRGRPALIGVSYQDDKYNHDKMTDHFVTVDGRGYDDEGRLFYSFKDPGDGGRAGRLYVDQYTDQLYREGDHAGGYVRNADYQMTHVRVYNDDLSSRPGR